MPSNRRRLAELSGPEVVEQVGPGSILVQPLGAIEQHGPHLPLNTDLVIAEAVADAAVDVVGDEVDAWLLPALASTKSNEHTWAPGTIGLSLATMHAVLDDLGSAVARTAARKLVFLNGHGGNSALVSVANRELRLDHGLMTFLAHPIQPADQGGTSDAGELGMGVHAGADETALMLHLRPDLVRMERAVRNVPAWMAENRHVRFGGRVGFGWLSDDFGPHGVIGDPTTATPERGRELFEAAVQAFVGALREVAAFELPRR